MNLNENRRTIEEGYSAATASSDLTVTTETRGDADYLIAAGWSQQLIGGALMRLHTEFERTGRQRRATGEQFARELESGQTKAQAKAQAAALAHSHNMNELTMLRAQIKSWPTVEQVLILQMGKWGVKADQARPVVVDVLCWWLDKVCQRCGGTMYETVPGTNRQSGRVCRSCSGTGERPLPHGRLGRKLAGFIEDCVGRGRESMRKRLRSMPHHRS